MKLKFKTFIIFIFAIFLFFAFSGVDESLFAKTQARSNATKTVKHSRHTGTKTKTGKSYKKHSKKIVRHHKSPRLKRKKPFQLGISAQRRRNAKKPYKKNIAPKYKTITISKGNFINALVRNRISTQTNNVGDTVYLIVENDFYVGDYKCIPENTILVGKIKQIEQPKIGTNGILKIYFYNMIFPDNTTCPMLGHVWSNLGDFIGGEITDYAEYRKVPNISTRVGPIMQMLPAGTRKMGTPTVLNSGDNKVIVLDEDLKIKIKE